MPNEVEILVTAKNLAKATFAGAKTQTTELGAAADRMDIAMRRAGLAAATAGDNAQRAMLKASAAADQAAKSQTAAAAATEKLAAGEISEADAAKAESKAQKDVAASADVATRSVRAQERAQIAAAAAARKAADAQVAAAAKGDAATGAMATGWGRLQKIGKVATQALVVGAVAVGFESTKMAMKFEKAMTMINTQAGVSKDKLKGLGDGVLKLAGQVGASPDSLAEALFHVESNMASMGISSQKALQMVKVAAEGAKVGGADLVDVTNALTAAVAANIPGVQNLDQAMGVLNATVGAGDMKMQDLADAFGTGMVATVKGFGLSISDVGAALAVFGDNNIRGAQAGTNLRMAVQALAKPAKTSASTLKMLGLTTESLAKDMQRGGLKLALEDLVAHMHKAGITSKQQGQVITDAFGKKAGTGINILVDQFARLESKYPDLAKGANNFAGAWATTQKTFSQRVDEIKQALDALMIKIGQKLLPVLSSMLGWFGKHTGVLKTFAIILGGVVVTAVLAYAVAMTEAAIATIAATWPILAIIAVIALLVAGVLYAWKHFAWFRDGVKAVGHAIAAMWKATWNEVDKVIRWFVNGPLKSIQHSFGIFTSWWHAHSDEIRQVTSAVWKFISNSIVTNWKLTWAILKPGLEILKATWTLIWGILRDTTKLIWNVIRITVRTGIRSVLDVIGIVLDLITGHWSRAWKDMKKLASDQLHGAISMIKALGSGFGKLLWDAGRNLVMGLVHGIQAVASAPYNAVKAIVGGISGLLPHSPAKTGPLSGSGSPDRAGKRIGQMLADGLTAGAGPVSRASTALVRAVTLPSNAPRLGYAAVPAQQQATQAPIYVTVMLGTTNLGELVIDPLRRSVRKRGGNVQAVLGSHR